MNPGLQRAQLLFQQSRHELAENELRQVLAEDPHDAYAHSLLGLSLAHQEKYQEATSETQQAIHLAPDFPFAHYAHAHVLHRRNRFPEALAAINEAIRLEPEAADQYALLSNIHLQERHWRGALNAAEQGLQFDPEHIGCTNLRAIAMVKLGRKADAGKTIEAALSRNPDNALTHANQGWTLLEQGEPKKAAEHFREALRLDPQNDWARRGIIEALKARNFIYAIMLKYFLWMAKFGRRGQWAILIGGFFGIQVLAGTARNNPKFVPWVLPIEILYITFALMTWMAYPFFNLLLRLNRFGRYALSREQNVASNWFGLCLFIALLGLGTCFIKGFVVPWITIALVFGLLLLPVSAVFKCHDGWPRVTMGTITIILTLLGVGGIALLADNKAASGTVTPLLGLFILGTVASTWVANFLAMQRPKR